MQKKKHHKVRSLKEILSYLSGKASAADKHQLEREMQQDPFLDEAVEGLSMADNERIRKDIGRLNQKIRKDSEVKAPRWMIGVAASVALLLVSVLGYVVVERIQTVRNETIVSQETLKTQEHETPVETPDSGEEDLPVEPEQPKPASETTPPAVLKEPEISREPVFVADIDMETAIIQEQTPAKAIMAQPARAEEPILEYEAVAPPVATLAEPAQRVSSQMLRNAGEIQIRQGITAQPQSQPIVAPYPAGGFPLYYQYIERNALLPDTATVKEARVIILFNINESGRPYNFSIIESPHDFYSEKAKEIFENGVDWITGKKPNENDFIPAIFEIIFRHK